VQDVERAKPRGGGDVGLRVGAEVRVHGEGVQAGEGGEGGLEEADCRVGRWVGVEARG
jgi:hypothetical protein